MQLILRALKRPMLKVALCLSLIGAQSANATPVCIKDSTIGKQLNLPVYEWIDPTKRRKGMIVAVHGLTLYAYAWNKFATHLAARGYRVFALDQRGFGRWRTESAKFNGTSKIEIGQSQQDLLDLATTLRQTHPSDSLFFLGESLGSNMSLLLVSEHPELTNGAMLGSPCHKGRIHPNLRMPIDFAHELVLPNRPLNLTPYSAPYLTNDPVLARICDTDPNIFREMTPVELVKLDLLNTRSFSAAKSLPADYPLLVFAGTADAMFKQNELPKAVKQFGTTNVTLDLFPGKGHLLLEEQLPAPPILNLVDSWLKAHNSKEAVAISTKTGGKQQTNR
jgi:alpha-beta hydrolase superfamily lysophospholipase